MSMFQLIPAPVHFPGVELLGLNSPEGVVDTGVDFNGHVYLGRQSVHEAATLFGYLAPEQAQAVGERMDALVVEVAALHRRLSDLDPIVKAIHNVASELDEETVRDLRFPSVA